MSKDPGKKPRRFTTYTEVEVDIPTHGLEKAGWVWGGEPNPEAPEIKDYLNVVEQWHNETHDGVYRFCAESPCREIGSL